MNKNWVIAAFLIIIIFNGYWLFEYNKSEAKTLGAVISLADFFWGSVTSVAHLFIEIIDTAPVITIDSPQNTTYYFNLSQNYDIELNVSANKGVQAWWYDHYNRNMTLLYSHVIFTPNTTFTAVFNYNTIAVYANDTNGLIGNTNVTFFVDIQDAAPIMNITKNLFVCEDNALSRCFYVIDPDEDNIEFTINPQSKFYVIKIYSSGNLTWAELFSGYLAKGDVGLHQRTVSAYESPGTYTDSANINITVIEINHHPQIITPVYTVWVNETMYYQVNANDTEDGIYSSGNLFFNSTFLNGAAFFDINETYGFINVTPNDTQLGNYNISICVTDQGLSSPDPNISLCGSEQDGSSMYNCSTLRLTVTDENRPPNITDYYPKQINITINYSVGVDFNISKYDPDGTVPDTYWYYDSSQILYGSDYLNDYVFNSGGFHTITVEITDGELNDSVTWNIVVNAPSSEAPYGGGGGGKQCVERWVCNETALCQDLERMRISGTVDYDTQKLVEIKCLEYGWASSVCGAKIVSCFDINKCGTNLTRPQLLRECYYVKEPSCNDGVRNCHTGACEVLVDCGGPCPACPTCNDGIKNQGEEGIDCGGPCPESCPEEKPLEKTPLSFYVFVTVTIVLLLAVIVAITYLIRIKKRTLK